MLWLWETWNQNIAYLATPELCKILIREKWMVHLISNLLKMSIARLRVRKKCAVRGEVLVPVVP
jgi:hypothetical protein